MEQLDTLQKNEKQRPDRNRWRLWCIMLFVLLTGAISSYGQISWDTGYPKMGSKLTIEGESGNLEISFTASSIVSDAKIELTLPSNVSFDFISDNGGTVTSFGASTTNGSKVTIPVSLVSGSIVKANIWLKAARDAKTGDEVAVQLLSGTSPIAGTLGKTAIEVQTPAITITATTGKEIVDCPVRDQEYDFEYNLKSVNGKARDFKVILTVDQYVTLGTFEYGGTPVTTVSETGNKVYTLTLTDLDETTGKTLTFKAQSSRDGSWPIKSQGVYPSEGTASSTTDGATLTMKGTDVAGKPYLDLKTVTYLASDDVSSTDFYGIQMNGSTPSLLKVEYKNTGTADAWDAILKVDVYSYRSFINTAGIKYQIGNGSVKTVPEAKVEGGGALSNNTSYGYFSTNKGKSRTASIPLLEEDNIKVDQVITYWIPVYNGATYDNGVENVYVDTPNTVWAGYTVSVSSMNSAGSAGGASPVSSTWAGNPHFRELPGSMAVKSDNSFTQKIRVSSGSTNSKAKTRINVQLPSWLELDGTEVKDAIIWSTTDGQTTYSPVANSGTTDPGNRIYSLQYDNLGNTSSLLSFKYKVAAGSCSGTNIGDTIRYWLNYEVNGTDLEHISQVKHPVTLLCKTEGITLDKVWLNRTTRGLKDSNENHLPDDGSEALFSEINHSIYMADDGGEIHWQGTIVGSSYKYLYLPITVGSGMTMGESGKTFNYQKDKIKVLIDDTEKSFPTSITGLNDGTQFYVMIDASSDLLTSGQKVEVSLEFITNKELGTSKQFVSECFVSNTIVSNPFDQEAEGREGKDYLSQTIASYGLGIVNHWNSWKSSYSFNNNDKQPVTGDTYGVFYDNPPAPYFEKEVRYHEYPYKVIWEVPDGYVLSGNLSVTRNSLEAANKGLPSDYASTLSLPVPVPDGNTYEFNMESLYNLSYEQEGDAIDNTKWVLPEDRWIQSFTVDIQATKGAKLGRSSLYRTIIYKNPKTKAERKVTNRATVYLDYSGTSTTLSTSVSELSTSSPKLSVPVVSFGNPNDITIKDNWLYIAGNVSNLFLKPIDGGSNTSGTGFEDRWLNVASAIDAGETKSFTLDFDYIARSDGKNDTIWVYTASGFGASWTPTTLSPIDLSDSEHIGARQMIIIKPADASVSGSIQIKKEDGSVFEKLVHTTPYQLVATISSRGSSGMVSNPKMEIVIPAGQEYVSGSASVSFAGTSYTPANLITALGTDNADPTVTRTVTFDLKDVIGQDVGMPGASATSTTEELMKEAVLTLKLRPMCNTILTGVRYEATLDGFNGTGTTLNSQKLLSDILLADVNSNYGYEVTVATADNNQAFNELQTTNSLKVTIKRNKGTTDNVNTTDSLLLILPQYLDLNGAATVGQGATNPLTIQTAEATAVTGSNEVVSGKREIRISVPVNSINTAPSKGFNQEFVYTIPVEYTPSGQDLIGDASHPVQASMTTSAQFGTCTATEASIGSGDIKIALITTKDNPGKGSVGKLATLEITTTAFTGKWYDTAGKANELSNSSVHTVTPDVMGDITYYVDVKLSSDATEYGLIPVRLSVYPSLEYTLGQPLASCDASLNYTLADFDALVTGRVSGVVYEFYKTKGLDDVLSDKVTGSEVITGTTSCWVQSYNGYETGSPREIAFTFNTPMSKPLANSSVSVLEMSAVSGSTGTVTITVSNVSGTPATGGNYTYRLYDSSNALVAITGTGRVDANTVVSASTNHVFTLTYDAPTAASASYNYYVKVAGECGESLASEQVTISVYPDPEITLLSTSESYCNDNTSLLSGITLWSLISNPNISLYDYTYSTDGSVFNALSSASPEMAKTSGTYTYTLRAKNKYTGSSKSADDVFALTVNTPMAKPVAAPSVSALEISAAAGSTGILTIAVSNVNGTPGTGGNYTYRLYDSNHTLIGTTGDGRVDGNAVATTATSHTFTLTYDVPAATSTIYNYYVKVSGECGDSEASDMITLTVYPSAELALVNPVSINVCEDNSSALSDISLWDYIDTPNALLEYLYDAGAGYTALTSSTVVAITEGPGVYTYKLKSTNAKGSESTEETVSITVQKKTVITKVDGYEVIEGDAINIVVVADGEGSLSYEWYEGSSTTPLAVTTTNTYQITPVSSIAADNGKVYRVVVKGESVCDNAERSFTLKVNSRVTPPLGNNKVTWDVIGYGDVNVTADGISISNGSHVNNGTKLVVTGTTWKSNVLKSITINGTEYSTSPISYTVNSGDVHIVVEFLGSDPNPDPDSNAEIESGSRIWTEGGYACIYTETAGRVRIVTFNGRIVTDQKMPEGESRIQLADGYYIVTLSDGTTKKVAIHGFK